MSDFFQILQREVDKPEADIKEDKAEPAFAYKETAVEKNEKKPTTKKTVKKIATKKNTTAPKQNVHNLFPAKLLTREIQNPIWLTMSEAAKLCGIQKKTVKRAIMAKKMEYRIVDNRYQVNLKSVILLMSSHKKLWNKMREHGLGQYVEKWWE